METREDAANILLKLQKNEKSLADLYQVCADMYPKQRNFWQELVKEEHKHAKMIEKLQSGFIPDIRVKNQYFEINDLEVSLLYIKEKSSQILDGALTHKEAVEMALEIETSMLERGFFEIFEGDSPQFFNTINTLREETQLHIEKIRTELEKKRWFFF